MSYVNPSANEAEALVIGACLTSEIAIGRALDILTPDDFLSERHRQHFRLIQERFARGASCDPLLVAEEAKLYPAERSALFAELHELVSNCPSSENIVAYCEYVAGASDKRNCAVIGQEMIDKAGNPTVSADELRAVIEEHVSRLSTRWKTGQQWKTMRELGDEAVDRAWWASQHKDEARGVPTGIKELDDLTGGFRDTTLILIGARPSMGKSILAFQFADAAAKSRPKEAVAFFSLEMSFENLSDRALTSASLVETILIQTGKLENKDFKKIREAAINMPTNLHVMDCAQIPMPQMRTHLKRLEYKHGKIRCVVADYLQLALSGEKTMSRTAEIGAVSRKMCLIAREFKCPVIAPVQINRQSDSRENKRPMMSELAESGQLERDADVIMFPYRPGYYQNEQGKQAGSEPVPDYLTELIVVKNRNNGKTGTIEMFFDRPHARFLDAGHWQQYQEDIKYGPVE